MHHKVPLNIRPCQAVNKWHPDKGIAWEDDLLEVFILTIGKVISLADKRLTATIDRGSTSIVPTQKYWWCYFYSIVVTIYLV
jgi:hypothetical protein